MTRSSEAAGVTLPRRLPSGASSSMGAAAASPPSLAAPSAAMPPPALSLPRGGRPSSKFGTVNYSVDEMRRLNAKVRAVLPLAGEDWMHVAYQFNYLRPESIPYREVESLKRKFKKMYCSRASAANGGKLPDYLLEAKELRRLINQRTEKIAAVAAGDGDGDAEAQRVRRSSSHSSNGSSRSPATSKPSGQTTTPNATDDAAPGASSDDELLRASGDSSSSYMPQQLLLSTEAEPEAARRKYPHSQSPPPGVEPTITPTALQNAETEAEAARDLSFKLRQLEDEARHVLEGKRPSSSAMETELSGSAEPSGASGVDTTSATPPLPSSAPTAATRASGTWADGGASSTSDIISMLRHSVERKRRTVEEQMLSESMRVRRERKKRKMEQALLSIHQEQREREGGVVRAESAASASSSTPVSTPPPVYAAPPPASPGRQPPLLSPLATTSASAAAPASVSASSSSTFFPAAGSPAPHESSSLGLMELLLQFMTAQQLESAQRVEAERARREQERREREQRRRHKERQRRQDHRELMLALAALLGGRFPSALGHHLEHVDAHSQQEAAPPSTAALGDAAGRRATAEPDAVDEQGDARVKQQQTQQQQQEQQPEHHQQEQGLDVGGTLL